MTLWHRLLSLFLFLCRGHHEAFVHDGIRLELAEGGIWVRSPTPGMTGVFCTRCKRPLLVDGAPVSVRLLDEGPRQPYCLLNKKKSG